MESETYLGLLGRMAELHKAKNAGYAGAENPDPWANFRSAEGWGVSALDGCLVRMGDKYARAQSLHRSAENEQVGEPLRDTLLDLASYALIGICLLDEEEAVAPSGRAETPIAYTVVDRDDVHRGPVHRWAGALDRSGFYEKVAVCGVLLAPHNATLGLFGYQHVGFPKALGLSPCAKCWEGMAL